MHIFFHGNFLRECEGMDRVCIMYMGKNDENMHSAQMHVFFHGNFLRECEGMDRVCIMWMGKNDENMHNALMHILFHGKFLRECEGMDRVSTMEGAFVGIKNKWKCLALPPMELNPQGHFTPELVGLRDQSSLYKWRNMHRVLFWGPLKLIQRMYHKKLKVNLVWSHAYKSTIKKYLTRFSTACDFVTMVLMWGLLYYKL